MFKKSLMVSAILVFGANSVFAQPVVVTEPTEAEKEKVLKFIGVDKNEKKKSWAELRAESAKRDEERMKEIKERKERERKERELKYNK